MIVKVLWVVIGLVVVGHSFYMAFRCFLERGRFYRKLENNPAYPNRDKEGKVIKESFLKDGWIQLSIKWLALGIVTMLLVAFIVFVR